MSSRYLEFAVRGGLAVAALIHLLPLPGVAGGLLLQSAYGLSEVDPPVALLLQHRALMFALFSLMLMAAMFQTALRNAAISLVLVSDLSFIVLCLMAAELNTELMRVAVADSISVVALIFAAYAEYRLTREGEGRPS